MSSFHISKEEGKNQRRNVRTINISIGHDYDFVIS